MKKITENYDTHTKEDLLSEAHSRGVEGVNTGSLKADIVAALELDDNTDKPDQPPAPLPKLAASPIPQLPKPAETLPVSEGGSLQDEDFTGGLFVMKEGNHVGEEFALAVHDANTYGRTHTLRNSIHQWEGTEKEFRNAFEKK